MKEQDKINEVVDMFEEVIILPQAADDIIKLVEKSGHIGQFYNIFTKRIEQLKELGPKAIYLQNFEKLKGAPDFYSMHLKYSTYNYRMLYSYIEDSKEILVHCFFEKQDSRITEYKKHIEIAEKRLQEWRRNNAR